MYILNQQQHIPSLFTGTSAAACSGLIDFLLFKTVALFQL